MARVHAAWFPVLNIYRSRTAKLIREGMGVSTQNWRKPGNPGRTETAADSLLRESGASLWMAPSALGPAPKGIEQTGDPAMGLPWTHSGLPSVSLPAGHSNGLPLGIQLVAPFMDDEKLLHWSCRLSGVFQPFDV